MFRCGFNSTLALSPKNFERVLGTSTALYQPARCLPPTLPPRFSRQFHPRNEVARAGPRWDGAGLRTPRWRTAPALRPPPTPNRAGPSRAEPSRAPAAAGCPPRHRTAEVAAGPALARRGAHQVPEQGRGGWGDPLPDPLPTGGMGGRVSRPTTSPPLCRPPPAPRGSRVGSRSLWAPRLPGVKGVGGKRWRLRSPPLPRIINRMP